MITTKYLGPRNTQGARIAVDSIRGRRVYAYDHSASDAHDAAVLRYIADHALPAGKWFCGVLRYGSRVYMHPAGQGSIIAPGLDTARPCPTATGLSTSTASGGAWSTARS